MAYATTNPPVKLAGNGPAGPQLWAYVHTDIHTDVDAAGYFTNGAALGMRANDIMLVVKSDATKGVTVHIVSSATTIEPAILA